MHLEDVGNEVLTEFCVDFLGKGLVRSLVDHVDLSFPQASVPTLARCQSKQPELPPCTAS